MVGSPGTLVPAASGDISVAAGRNERVRAVLQDTTQLSCGPHTVLLDLRRTTPIWEHGYHRLRAYRDNREVWSLSEEAGITEVACKSLTGDGVPGLILTTYSFGAHCCTTIYVLSLRSEPKLLLQFLAGHDGGYDIRDLKGTGTLQLILGDDTFSYFGGLSFAGSPSLLPLVACYRNGSFVDCTREFPDVVQESIESYRARLEDSRRRIESGELEASPWWAAEWDADFWIAGHVLGIYADLAILGQERAGWAVVRSEVRSTRVLKWFECHRPTVQRWAGHREKEILHDSGPSHATILSETPGCEKWALSGIANVPPSRR